MTAESYCASSFNSRHGFYYLGQLLCLGQDLSGNWLPCLGGFAGSQWRSIVVRPKLVRKKNPLWTVHDTPPCLDAERYPCSHWPIFTKLGEMSDADEAMDSQHFGSGPADIRIRIRINPEIRIRIADHFPLIFQPWWSLRSLSALVNLLMATLKLQSIAKQYGDSAAPSPSSLYQV